MRGDGEDTLFAYAHIEEALFPALDHLSSAKDEFELLVSADGAIKDRAICELTSVVHGDLVTVLGLAVTRAGDGNDVDFQLRHSGRGLNFRSGWGVGSLSAGTFYYTDG